MKILTVLIIASLVVFVSSTISRSDKKKKAASKDAIEKDDSQCQAIEVLIVPRNRGSGLRAWAKAMAINKGNATVSAVGPDTLNVYEKKLVTEDVTALGILQQCQSYFKDTQRKNINQTTLGYVTPWNNHGYDTAKWFAQKFSLISPVWLQVRPNPGGSGYVVTGLHDVDNNWISDVKKNNSDVKILPRVLFDGWTGADLGEVLTDTSAAKKLAKTITSSLKKFDGAVVEVWSQFGGQMANLVLPFIKTIGQSFRKENLLYVLAIPPPIYAKDVRGMITAQNVEDLASVVDYFSLMTYDYSSPASPGPNAPLPWVKRCVEMLVPDSKSKLRRKILVGLNFYGNDYTINGGGPITGSQYLDILRSQQQLKISWEANWQEHWFEYRLNGRRVVFFPTPLSIKQRIDLAEELGTGISIWELGQGLDCFFDLV